ncbi:MAG: hypothetical protein JF606_24445 [Burkholderiales bacterium]|nr:hypothetical protein [Burkholderiales bacterium]
MPQRDSAAVPPHELLSAADSERIAKLKGLGNRVNEALDFLGRIADSALKRRVLVQAYENVKKMLSIHENVSPTVDAPPKPVWCALTLVDELVSTLSDDVQVNASEDLRSSRLPPVNPHAAQEQRLRLTQRLKQLAEQSREIQDYKQFMQALSKLPEVRDSSNAVGPIREETDRCISRTMSLADLTAIGALWSHHLRLMTYELPAALQGTLDELVQLSDEVAALGSPLEETGPDAAQEGYRQAREQLQALVRFGRASDRFAQAAAEDWSAEGGESERWKHQLEFADALSSFMSTAVELVAKKARDYGAMVTSAVEPHGRDGASTSSASAPGTTDAVSDHSAGTRRSRRSRPNRRRSAEKADALSAVATTDPRELALTKAHGLLRSHPLTREMVQRSNADVLSVARDSGKDIGALEAMSSGGHEAYSIAHMARESVRRWFGDAKPLLQARDEMSSLLQAGAADDGDGVAAPVKLDSAADKGNLGTLFELQIQPKALADGSDATPLFLHMHASKLMSAEQAMTLPFDQFTAVHVKTGKQKNLGARWEEIQQRLGNFDARVHRGKVDSALLNQLRRKAAGFANAC